MLPHPARPASSLRLIKLPPQTHAPIAQPAPQWRGKIALITRSGGGGVARHILDLLRLQRDGVGRFHGVFTILSESFRRRLAPFAQLGFTWDELPMRRTPAPWQDLWNLDRLTRLLARADVAAVHTHGTKAGYLGRLAALRLGLPTIHTPHTFPMEIHTLERTLIKPALTLAERALATFTDTLVLLTPSQQQLAAQWDLRPQRQLLIANGVDELADPDWVAGQRVTQRARWRLPAAAPVAIWVGRFDPQKNPDLLVLTGVRWLLGSPRAHLMLVGATVDGPDAVAARMQRRFADAGVADRVRFTGEQDNVDELLCAADLFLHTSHYEGMPYVVLEAFRTGLPAVLTDIAAHRELLTDGVEGHLCAANSAALSRAMQTALIDSEHHAAMRAAARRRAARHGLNRFHQAHTALYRRLLPPR